MRKYKVGAKLKAVRTYSGFIKGDIVEIIAPKSYYSSYALKNKSPQDGWDTKFVDDERNFEPVKITNWRERIK